eukprot:6457788-Amphidinium_carterae.2
MSGAACTGAQAVGDLATITCSDLCDVTTVLLPGAGGAPATHVRNKAEIRVLADMLDALVAREVAKVGDL